MNSLIRTTLTCCLACVLSACGQSNANDTPAQAKTRADLSAIGLISTGDALARTTNYDWPAANASDAAVIQIDEYKQYLKTTRTSYGPYKVIADSIQQVCWSEDGSTVAYLVQPNRDDYSHSQLAINGQLQPIQKGIFNVALSADGKHFGYVALEENGFRMHVYIDGKDVGNYFRASEIVFSPDGNTAIWIAADQQPLEESGPGGYDVYVNGQKFSSHFFFSGRELSGEPLSSIAFSPDSKHWAVRGIVFGPMTPQAGGVGGFAVMADGKMGPTFFEVSAGTVQYSGDSSELIYAAGDPGKYAVYRNDKPGATWDYINQRSLWVSRDGKTVAFTGHQSGTSRFEAPNPMPGRPNRSTGLPALVINDAIAVKDCTTWAVSEDGKHILAAQYQLSSPTSGPMPLTLNYDGQSVDTIEEFPRSIDLKFSPNGQHWLAIVNDRFSAHPHMFIDAKRTNLIPETYPTRCVIDNAGQAAIVAEVAKSVWALKSK